MKLYYDNITIYNKRNTNKGVWTSAMEKMCDNCAWKRRMEKTYETGVWKRCMEKASEQTHV